MKNILSVSDVRMSDKLTIESGIPSKELMYKAALGVYNSYMWHGKIGIFCGSGNNAGDGYALAIILKNNGYYPELVLVSNKFSDDGLFYYNQCIDLQIPIRNFSEQLEQYDIYVDALLGTGFKGDLKPSIYNCIKYINDMNKPTISIDINSGLNGDTGLCEYAVKSDLTVSIGYSKPGLYLNKAKDFIKEIVTVDIGLVSYGKPYSLIEHADASSFFKTRLNYSNKGTYGYVGIMGGSENYPGAVRLANLGQVSLRSGCGVSKLIVPSEIYELIFSNVLETTVVKIPSKLGKMIYDENAISEALKGLRVLGIGVGWGESEEYIKILSYILLNYEIPVVIDADGLNTLSKMDLNILNSSKCKIILTPHLKEFSRLTNYSVNEISNNLIQYGKEFVSKYNVTLLLKGATTLVFDNQRTYLITNGNSGMATAGSGDVLTGIITGLLGYHCEDVTMTVAVASYINGLAGDLAAKQYGEISMLSSDTAYKVGEALSKLVE